MNYRLEMIAAHLGGKVVTGTAGDGTWCAEISVEGKTNFFEYGTTKDRALAALDDSLAEYALPESWLCGRVHQAAELEQTVNTLTVQVQQRDARIAALEEWRDEYRTQAESLQQTAIEFDNANQDLHTKIESIMRLFAAGAGEWSLEYEMAQAIVNAGPLPFEQTPAPESEDAAVGDTQWYDTVQARVTCLKDELQDAENALINLQFVMPIWSAGKYYDREFSEIGYMDGDELQPLMGPETDPDELPF